MKQNLILIGAFLFSHLLLLQTEAKQCRIDKSLYADGFGMEYIRFRREYLQGNPIDCIFHATVANNSAYKIKLNLNFDPELCTSSANNSVILYETNQTSLNLCTEKMYELRNKVIDNHSVSIRLVSNSKDYRFYGNYFAFRELQFWHHTCMANEFTCFENKRICLPLELKCDGTNHCSDGTNGSSDEDRLSCTTPSVSTFGTLVLITMLLVGSVLFGVVGWLLFCCCCKMLQRKRSNQQTITGIHFQNSSTQEM